MSAQSFWDQELERDWYWLFQHLSTTCFTLTAVSFASLFGIFAIPAFKGSVPPVVISLLLVAGALLAFAGEMAREAYFLWKVLAAEAAYTVGLAVLLVSYLLFAYSQSAILANPIVVITIIGLVMLFLCWRMVHNVRVLQRHVKSMSKEDGTTQILRKRLKRFWKYEVVFVIFIVAYIYANIQIITELPDTVLDTIIMQVVPVYVTIEGVLIGLAPQIKIKWFRDVVAFVGVTSMLLAIRTFVLATYQHLQLNQSSVTGTTTGFVWTSLLFLLLVEIYALALILPMPQK